MSESEIVTVGRALPKLASVEPANGPFSIRVTWASGQRAGHVDVVDLAPAVFTFKVFAPLRTNPGLFASVRLGEWGASVVWEGHDDLDIGAEAIEEMAEEVMTSAEFAAFLKQTGLTYDAAAAQLGISRRLVAYYAKERAVPRYIMLACRELERSLSPEDSHEQESAVGWLALDGDQVVQLGIPHGLVFQSQGELHSCPNPTIIKTNLADRSNLTQRFQGLKITRPSGVQREAYSPLTLESASPSTQPTRKSTKEA